MPLPLALERPEKERGFSAPLLERKHFDFKRESIMIMFGSFFPSLLVGWHHQSLLGSREPALSWNQLQCAGLTGME